MWTVTHRRETSARAEAIFARYADPASWPEWDAGLERLDLDGPFVAGTTGTMVPRGQDPLPMRLVAVDAGRGFEDETPVPGAGVVVRVRHQLEPLERGGTLITHTLTIDGPAADAVGPTLGAAITADFPQTMAALAACAEGTLAAR
ncbi:MAG TPA: SRPBCC family protein [Chloroflexota bacterium]|nr:SRPBCC family protein [Chloroflexota bacterium]